MSPGGVRPRRTHPARVRARLLTAVLGVAALLLAAACTQASPEGTAGSVAAQSEGVLGGRVIVIDPGHNGGNAEHPEVVDKLVDVVTKKKPCDTTGTETNDGYPEHAFNWDVAERLAAVLRERGATVLLTREGDDGVGPCITERAAVANDAGADVAVSIHADGGSAKGHGFHIMEPVLVKGHNDEIVKPSHQLAIAIRDAYEEGTGLPPADYIGDDGLNPRDDMGGLNLTTVPKVMVECGNMRHKGDAEKLSDADFRQKIAESIAAGLTTYLEA
ncbi:N-acetylmuramoyl-L-alanine amidase [Phytomonospora endophytica]|uniref:N-acetylmuramoyl-L-alanine amidase n=1 Tax=Phytomonospora endophytica TaxID=714109 RepID=A0A841FPM0_9ACTN|nr:N-acetylmuramoyl-L-alanine amidase [Phytomonospora endophytica]MBB6038065.1 N-acetylmuramoyl-L-alanine amidase [Phytomonospora endophytica]GIG67471.1 hypothetical protein Pen01_37660 [Phytomonospora endophytica]